MSSKVFKRTGSLMPGRSVFDLSYDKKMTADMGYLYPHNVRRSCTRRQVRDR